MKISINNILYALADALDYVEGEMLGATTYHSRRVAYIAILMGRKLGLSDKELMDLAASCVLHDNALTEYNQSELNRGIDILKDSTAFSTKGHCVMGEQNVSTLPFYQRAKGAILYHHEEADGSGPFGLKTPDIPLYARIIHIADITDVAFDLSDMNYNKYQRIINFVDGSNGIRFDDEMVRTFNDVCTYGQLCRMDNDYIVTLLHDALPIVPTEYTSEDMAGIAAMFAKITDYKSSFTSMHSQGVADKAKELSIYYGFDNETVAKMYFAGALHDVGKLIIENDILEKEDKLTDSEYVQMKNHAYASWEILGRIDGIDDIREWASLHHEKLDGSGYPFGKKANELSEKDRIIACVDIYQALTEERPYKHGMSHEKVIEIMNDEVAQGKLDARIVEDIDKCFEPSAINQAS